jgi:hypothetical protein
MPSRSRIGNPFLAAIVLVLEQPATGTRFLL